MEKTNVNGGAIALGTYLVFSDIFQCYCFVPAVGHPLAASGSRITSHLVHEMKRRGFKQSVGSACIGGGQGIALLLENC